MNKNCDQWEGFEEFCQSNGSDENKINNMKDETNGKQKNNQNKKNTIQKETEDLKSSSSPYKKNKIKVKVVCAQPAKQQQNVKQNQNEDQKNVNINDFSSPNKSNNKNHRLQRIPIMRKQDDYRYVGNVVYRSFAPRSSDTYFRILKEVDYTAISSENKFKGSQTFQFNSKIQSGNLGAVFQGWRSLV